MRDVTDEAYAPYLINLPQDPQANGGITYLYLSNTKRFQLYTYLEGKESEDGYSPGMVGRNLECGKNYICSFGKSFGETPLDKSIEKYEQILLEKM